MFFSSAGDYRHAGPKGPEEVFSRERSRGTGPRATVDEAAALLTRSGSGEPELQFHAPILLILEILKILLLSCKSCANDFLDKKNNSR